MKALKTKFILSIIAIPLSIIFLLWGFGSAITDSGGDLFLILFIILILAAIVLPIWTIFDSRKLLKQLTPESPEAKSVKNMGCIVVAPLVIAIIIIVLIVIWQVLLSHNRGIIFTF